jgi:hypothetical protein
VLQLTHLILLSLCLFLLVEVVILLLFEKLEIYLASTSTLPNSAK